jgi:hypothetical protein
MIGILYVRRAAPFSQAVLLETMPAECHMRLGAA